MPHGDLIEQREQRLEAPPPTRLIDDQLVLGERAVLERLLRLGLPEPPRAEESSRERAVAEEPHPMPRAEWRHRARGTTIE